MLPGVWSEEKCPSTCDVRSSVSVHPIPHTGQIKLELLLSIDIGVLALKQKGNI